MNIFLVGLGGCLGALSRFGLYQIEKYFTFRPFPLATFIINMLGCFLAGLVYAWAKNHLFEHKDFILFALVGFIGSFTTFSTFSLDCLELINSDRFLMALAYVLMSVILGLFAVWSGMKITSL